jgi:hypothetical protein
MTPKPTTSRWSPARVTVPAMGACVLLSVAVHLGTALGAGVYLSQRTDLQLGDATRITMNDTPSTQTPDDPPMRLGRTDAKSAAIAWLGVTQDPVLGQGQESEVEQAELTMVQGERDSAQAIPTQQAQPTPTTQQPTPPTEPAAQPERAPDPVPEPVPDQQEPPKQLPPINANDPEPEIESIESEQVEPEPAEDIPLDEEVIDTKPEEESPTQAEENSEPAETTPQTVNETEDAQPIEQSEQAPVVESTPQPETTPSPGSTQQPQGKPGEVDNRESVASIIKRAQEVRASTLNRPLSGEGLEIRPVEPKFPASVRFTQLPRNPIVLIRFNAQGRVVNAKFLRDEEKKKVYDTGSKGVDEPLINAIYTWRAVGKQIDALDPEDPESVIEISMKILFRDE